MTIESNHQGWLRKAGYGAFWFTKLAYEDIKSTRFDIGLLESIRLWSRGFSVASFVGYSCEENRLEDYLSDAALFSRTRHINGAYSMAAHDKLLFYSIMRAYDDCIPAFYGLIQQGRLIPLQNNNGHHGNALPVTDVLNYDDHLVLKPSSYWKGKGILFLKHVDGHILVNEEEVSLSRLEATLKPLDGYLVTAFVEQGSYAASIFPEASNTVRMLTMWDLNLGTPFIAAAFHRIGTKYNIPMDHMGNGGIGASIDLKTGVMGPAAWNPHFKHEAPVWLSKHPDTGALIEGVQIPNWDKVTEKMLTIAGSLPHIPYIGWDIIVQDNGFKIVESNNLTDTISIQMHSPLLKDPRVRNFYAHYGVI